MQELCGQAYLSVYILEQSLSTGTIIIIAILKARHDNYHIKCCVWCAPKLTGIMERLNKLGWIAKVICAAKTAFFAFILVDQSGIFVIKFTNHYP